MMDIIPVLRYACCVCVFAGRPVMIVVEYMENGSLDSFLRVSVEVISGSMIMSVSGLQCYS